MLRESTNEWTSKWLAEGRVEGQVIVMRRLAVWKFGPETAERLAERLAEIADPDRVGDVGEWLIECDDGDTLLARVERLCAAPATAGEGA